MLVIRISIIVVSVCAVFMAIIYILQPRFVYYPEHTLLSDPNSIGLKFESVYFETEDGVRLSGWFIPSENARGVILFCHGNAGNISHRLDSIEIFHRLELDIFIFDYRGYGQSEGKPTEQGTYEDAKAAWRYLTEERQLDSSEIIVFGRSLGGAIASWLTQSHAPRALILESSFVSIRDIATMLYRFLPVKLLLRFEYNTAEHLTKVNCPVLIVHSRDDEIMPFSQGQQLFKVAREPKKLLEITGTHNEGFITSGELYEEGLNAFISECIEPETRQ